MLTRQFLIAKEVADWLKGGEVTVRHWIKGSKLRGTDVGREWRIVPSDLEHFLERRETTPQSNGKTPREAGVNLCAEEPEGPPSGIKKLPAGKGRAD